MHGYDIIVSQHIDENRIPIGQGYYVVDTEGEINYTETICSKELNLITIESFEEILYKECCTIIENFSKNEQNKNVYAFSLYTNEHNEIIVYLNTVEQFKDTLQGYIDDYPEYAKKNMQRSLKYSLGDFSFAFYGDEHFSEFFSSLFNTYREITECIREGEGINFDFELIKCKDINLVFESKLFDNALYSIVLNVTKRLKNHFNILNTTEDFIAFASSGNDYIDYSLSMRKTIEKELFYELFPEEKENDMQFEKTKADVSRLNFEQEFDFWFDEVLKDDYRTGKGVYSKYIKTEYEAVRALGDKGKDCIKDIFRMLHCIVNKVKSSKIEKEDYQRGFLLCELLIYINYSHASVVDKLLSYCNILENETCEKGYWSYFLDQLQETLTMLTR